MGVRLTPAYGYATRPRTRGGELYVLGQPVLLDTSGSPTQMNDVVFTSNGLQVLRPGTYHVQFAVSTVVGDLTAIFPTVVLEVTVNGMPPAETQYASEVSLNTEPEISLTIPQHSSVILTLEALDIIRIVPTELIGIPQGGYNSAYLQVIQIA